MRLLLCLLLLPFLVYPLCCFTHPVDSLPVIIQNPLSKDVNLLADMNFHLHARCGDMLIGTIQWKDNSVLPEGVILLPEDIADFSGIYQVDMCALDMASDLDVSPFIVFQTTDWLLIRGQDAILHALSSAGVHFRAISPHPYLPHLSPAFKDELDDMDPFVGVILDQVSSTSYQGFLQTLQDFITRNTYNPECDSAAFWILQQFESFGLSAQLDTFQIGAYTKYNVIAEKLGSQDPDQIYYITAHYDATAGLPVLPEAQAPGADDDASGTALVLECARVMAQFDFHKTIRFAVFAGNEQGLLGSEAYVAGLPQAGETYLGTFNADMTGYSGSDPWPPDLVIYSNDDPASTALGNKIGEAVSIFLAGFLEPIILQDPTMVYADHSPFWDASIAAITAMEDEVWGTDLNPHYHSVNDLIQYLDIPYAIHVLEAILAAVADLAIPSGSTEPSLTTAGVSIDDSLGNNNGQIEYGESIFMTIPIINVGGADALSVDVSLSESDPYISLSDWQENYGLVAAQDTVSVLNAFAGDVSTSVPDEHQFDITVSMSWANYNWVSQVQMIAHAPVIAIATLLVNDTQGGNGDGKLDPGETANLEITLENQGSYVAQNLTASLTCTSPYITVNTSSNTYDTLNPGSSAMREFSITALLNAPSYFQADFTLNYAAAGDWAATDEFTLYVGDVTHLPTGPDSYGYAAYDVNDEPFAPIYNWMEIDPQQGGPGTLLNFTEDDQTLHLNLPFNFTYYGQTFSEISVCSNGWVACGNTVNTDYSNSGIPDADGPAAMIAPFWEDLSPQADGTVSYFYNATEGLFIVEYNNVRDFQPNWHHMTFEVVLYDPALHPTSTGDGKILFQYGNLDNTSSCTVGIENPTETDGIQYLYNTNYDSTATPISDGMAILFTTGEEFPDVQVSLTPYGTPIQIPASGGVFDYNIAVLNNETTSHTFDVWCDVTLPNGSPYGPVLGPVQITLSGGVSIDRDRSQAVPAAAPAGDYLYNAYVGSYPGVIWSSDAFGFTKLTTGNGLEVGDWENGGEPLLIGETSAADASASPAEFHIGTGYPNPFNSWIIIPLQLPQKAKVRVDLFNIRGQRVAKIFDNVEEAGRPLVRYEASSLPSGIYLCRTEIIGLDEKSILTDFMKIVLLK